MFSLERMLKVWAKYQAFYVDGLTKTLTFSLIAVLLGIILGLVLASGRMLRRNPRDNIVAAVVKQTLDRDALVGAADKLGIRSSGGKGGAKGGGDDEGLGCTHGFSPKKLLMKHFRKRLCFEQESLFLFLSSSLNAHN